MFQQEQVFANGWSGSMLSSQEVRASGDGGNPDDAVAVIGFSLKFPDEADTAEGFWKLMSERRCAMAEYPEDRLTIDSFYQSKASRNDGFSFRGGHFIKEDIAAFDAGFFSITPSEAAAMDPAQRIMLETTYRAFENAGATLQQVSGSNTAVLTGCFTDDYKTTLLRDPEQIPKYAATGNSMAILANRVSWFFNLSGASCNIDSACSSSAIGIDQACQLLRANECPMAVVAGCNIMFAPDFSNLLTKMDFLSPDSKCYSFDSRANGYARGEGVGVVILKLVKDAIRDRDTIRAVIRASGMNQDGKTPGLTQPSSSAQKRLIEHTYSKAGLSMEPTRFIEAHGTGTALGDPLESNAFGGAFRKHRSPDDRLYVGAVKSNLGHLEAASGIAGLIKTIMILESGVIAPNTNFERLNRKIDADYLRIQFPQTSVPWPTGGLRRASLNSFGFGGSNTHVVVDDAYNFLKSHSLQGNHNTNPTPPADVKGHTAWKDLSRVSRVTTKKTTETPTPNKFSKIKILPLCATDEEGPARLAKGYQDYFSSEVNRSRVNDEILGNLAYTLDSRRTQFSWRSYAVLNTSEELLSLENQITKPVRRADKVPRLGFIFTGQGAQWFAMGRELFVYPTFRNSIQDSTEILGGFGCDWSIEEELMRPEEESRVNDPEFSQTLSAALQIALVDLLEKLRLHASAVIGHSSGEIGAAYAIGALCKESALKVAYYRGILSASIPQRSNVKGGMISIGLSTADVQEHLDEVNKNDSELKAAVSCVNSPSNVTVSAEEKLIDELESKLREKSIFARKLRTGSAYHSPQMGLIAKDYREKMGQLSPGKSSHHCVMISTVAKSYIEPEQLREADYWVQNLLSRVEFSDGIVMLCENSRKGLTKKIDGGHRKIPVVDCLVEVGPHSTLRGPTRDTLKSFTRGEAITYGSVLRRKFSATETLLQLMGDLWSQGVNCDLRAANDPEPSVSDLRIALVDLPEYPFDHQRTYWHESRLSKDYRFREQPSHNFLGTRSNDWNPLNATWRQSIRLADLPWIPDHVINGTTIYPGAGMLIMAVEAAKQIADPTRSIAGYRICDVAFEVALDLSTNSQVSEIQLSLEVLKASVADSVEWQHFTVYSYLGDRWQRNSTGKIQLVYEAIKGTDNQLAHCRRLWSTRNASCSCVDPTYMYRYLNEKGLEYGPAFQRMTRIASNSSHEAIADISVYSPGVDTSGVKPYVVHPTTLDAILHVLFPALSDGGSLDMSTHIPTAIRNIWIADSGLNFKSGSSVKASARTEFQSPRKSINSVFAMDDKETKLLVSIEGLETSVVASSAQDAQYDGQDQVWTQMTLVPDADSMNCKQLTKWLRSESDSLGLTKFESYLNNMSSRQPNMRVLRIEARSDHLTETVIDRYFLQETDSKQSVKRCLSYDIAVRHESLVDAVVAEIPNAKVKANIITLDVQADLKEQSAEEGKYDVIVYVGMSQTIERSLPLLKNMRRLVKNGGKTFFCQIAQNSAQPSVRASSSIGNEKVSTCDSCLAYSESSIHSLFKRTGFGGVELQFSFDSATIPDCQIFVSSAINDGNPASNKRPIAVLVDEESESQRSLAEEVEAELIHTGHASPITVGLQKAADLAELSEHIFVSLLEAEKPFLLDISERNYGFLKTLLLTAKAFVWVSGGGGSKLRHPGFGLIDGLSRALTLEVGDLQLVTLALNKPAKDISMQAERIAYVLTKSFEDGKSAALEPEYVEVDGTLHVRRMNEDRSTKRAMSERLSSKKTATQRIEEAGPAVAKLETSGDLETLHFVQDDNPPTYLGPSDVEIEVKAVNLNISDQLEADGFNNKSHFGHECAGIVRRCGVECLLRPGDRVCALSPGCLRSIIRCQREFVASIPDTISFELAATLPADYSAALHLIHDVAKVTNEDSVLVCTGVEPLGRALIQVLKNIGARIFTTTRSQAESDFLASTFGFHESMLLPSTGFLPQLKHFTRGRGVNVIFWPLHTEEIGLLESISPFGRLVCVKRPSYRNYSSQSLARVIESATNVTVSIVDFETVLREQPSSVCKFLQHAINSATNTHIVQSQEVAQFVPSKLQDAFRCLKSGNCKKKVVVSLPADEEIAVTKSTAAAYSLSKNATYVISGGLGGLGRSLSRCLAKCGAKNLLLLSRSGPKNKAAHELLDELSHMNVRVETPRCDVTDIHGLRRTIDEYAQRMPPIKGCIQASMVLKDIIFEKMSWQDWTSVIRPKALGAWNLHQTLPLGLDFFAMTSSISGVLGHISQVNYGAGNTFQDALAHYRIARGERAVSLDLGVLAEEGFLVEEKGAVLDRLTQTGFYQTLSQHETLAIFEHFCDPQLPAKMQRAQPIVGIKTPTMLASEGRELSPSLQRPLWNRFDATAVAGSALSSTAERSASLPSLIQRAQSTSEVGEIVSEALIKYTSRLLSIEEKKIDKNKPIHSYGLDSLSAVELRNWIKKSLGVDVAVFDIMGGAAFATVGLIVAKHLAAAMKENEAAAAASASA